jgi:hypothetical protein
VRGSRGAWPRVYSNRRPTSANLGHMRVPKRPLTLTKTEAGVRQAEAAIQAFVRGDCDITITLACAETLEPNRRERAREAEGERGRML